jgi:hypothetical protein
MNSCICRDGAGVSRLTTMVTRNETGIPITPAAMLLRPFWVSHVPWNQSGTP